MDFWGVFVNNKDFPDRQFESGQYSATCKDFALSQDGDISVSGVDFDDSLFRVDQPDELPAVCKIVGRFCAQIGHLVAR